MGQFLIEVLLLRRLCGESLEYLALGGDKRSYSGISLLKNPGLCEPCETEHDNTIINLLSKHEKRCNGLKDSTYQFLGWHCACGHALGTMAIS